MNPAGASKNAFACGVRIVGSGSAVPPGVLTNADLEKMVDTSDEWIVQRTGIRERRIVNQETEGSFTLSRDSLQRALEDAKMDASELDLVIIGTVTAEMNCPSNACRVSAALGATNAGAFDVIAACSGYVYSINIAESLIRTGRYKKIGVVGCDALSTITDFTQRGECILFGDGAGAMILERDDDPSLGCFYQTMGADGSKWETLYLPRREQEIPKGDADNPVRMGCLRMQGREVYKFAVTKFRDEIVNAMEATGLTIDDVDQFICHQSNLRIIESAKEKIGLPDEKVHINIDRYGNCSAGSIGLSFDELWRAGKIKRGGTIMLIAFGGGLTWSCSLWKL